MGPEIKRLFSARGQITTALHCSESRSQGPLIIMYPGDMGDLDGFNQKYLKIAEMLSNTIGPVLRCDNKTAQTPDYAERMASNLSRAIGYAAELIAEKKVLSKEIFLFGFSAGGSVVASVAHKHNLVTRILLVAPSFDISEDVIKHSLFSFKGQAFMVAAGEDKMVKRDSVERMATYAARTKLFIADGCDHQFRGTQNGIILSSLFLWAFGDITEIPDFQKGIRLY